MSTCGTYHVWLPELGQALWDGDEVKASNAAQAAELFVIRQCCRDIEWRSYQARVVNAADPTVEIHNFEVNVISTPIFKAKPLKSQGPYHG